MDKICWDNPQKPLPPSQCWKLPKVIRCIKENDDTVDYVIEKYKELGIYERTIVDCNMYNHLCYIFTV